MAQQYASAPFQILAFPCAQFENQEPGSNAEILPTLFYVRPGNAFKPMFPVFEKSSVNGIFTNPVFSYLKSSCSIMPQTNLMDDTQLISWTPVTGSDISWNFEKFLIDKTGKPFKRYTYTSLVTDLIPDIESLLSQ
jgi:glutathione peroxidase